MLRFQDSSCTQVYKKPQALQVCVYVYTSITYSTKGGSTVLTIFMLSLHLVAVVVVSAQSSICSHEAGRWDVKWWWHFLQVNLLWEE